MSADQRGRLAQALEKHESRILAEWIDEQRKSVGARPELIREDEAREQSRRLLVALRAGLTNGRAHDITAPEWDEARALLGEVSRSRALQGFSPSETATFVFSLKQPLFRHLQPEVGNEEIWAAAMLLDQLGLYTTFDPVRDASVATVEE